MRGTRVICTSDVHLYPSASEASRQMVADLAQRLDTWQGAGVLVLAGDCFEGLAVELDVDHELDAHPEFEAAVLAFSRRENCEVHLLPGNHDGQIAWDDRAQLAIRTRLGAAIAMRVDLVCETEEGEKRVRIQHGNSYDHSNAFIDPRDPVDTPLGHHVVREVLPSFRDAPGSLLEGVEWLGDPQQILQFLGSRLAYRQIIRRAWWLLLPFLAAFLLKAVTSFGLLGDHVSWARSWREWITMFGLIVLVDLAVIGAILVVVSKRVQEAVVAARPGGHDTVKNETPRRAAQQLVLEHGYIGLISGHTHYPQLVGVQGGFYANDGCGVETVEAREARFGLPAPFGTVLRQSWVILSVDDDVTVDLYVCDVPVPSRDALERFATKPSRAPSTPTKVASWPEGPFYPVREPKLTFAKRRIAVRRTASIGGVAVGVLMLLFALLPPLQARLEVLLEWVPLAATQVSSGVMIDIGLWLILASRGLRRGQREAYWLTVALLVLSLVFTVLHGFSIEATIVPLLALGWLGAKRSYFRTRWDRHALRRAITVFVLGNLVMFTAIMLVVGTLGTEGLGDADTPEEQADIVGREDTFDLSTENGRLEWMSAIAGAAIVIGAGLVLFGSPRRRRESPETQARNLARAREVWGQAGHDSLSYFTLRNDREWFFADNGMVAYAVVGHTFVLNTDPVCEPSEMIDLWADFADHADRHGASITVLAGTERWLATYEAAGMDSFHLGDEAILPVARFDPSQLDDTVLRHHRAHADAGWNVQFHTNAEILDDPARAAALVALRDAEVHVTPALSLALGRFLDPADTEVLVAVMEDADGQAVGVAQLVPAPELDGYAMAGWTLASATLEALDHFVVATVLGLQARGVRELSIGVVGAELGDENTGSAATRAERRRLRRLSEAMLMKERDVAARYQPKWRPRWVSVEPVRRSVRGAMRSAEQSSHSDLDSLLNA